MWRGKETLAVIFHRVLALDTIRHVSVRDMMTASWDPDTLRRTPRGGVV